MAEFEALDGRLKEALEEGAMKDVVIREQMDELQQQCGTCLLLSVKCKAWPCHNPYAVPTHMYLIKDLPRLSRPK